MTVESENSKPDLNNSEQEDIDKKLAEKLDELDEKVLFLAENAHKIEPPEKREEFKKELTDLLLKLENELDALSQNGE